LIMSTPTKRKLVSSPLKSPTSKGKPVDVSGYLIHVGNVEVSRNDNKYFDVKVQVTQSDSQSVRFMINDDVKIQEMFTLKKLEYQTENKDLIISFKRVFVSNDTTFFNISKGSTYVFEEEKKMSFKKDELCTSIKDIQTKDSGMFDVIVSIKWLADKKEVSNGSICRECIIADDTGDMSLTIWRDSLISLFEENVTYKITDLNLKNYFGLKLSTSGKTSFEKRPKEIKITWPDLAKYRFEESTIKNRKTLKKAELCGVVISCQLLCSGVDCRNVLEENDSKIITCRKCKRQSFTSKCPMEVIGKLDIDDLTLNFSVNVIDDLFGEGTCSFYITKISELEKKILLLEFLDVVYDIRTLDVVSLNFTQEGEKTIEGEEAIDTDAA